MDALRQILLTLGINLVPIAGVTLSGWNAATAMVLYWCDNLLSSILITLRIYAHEQLTHKRGHYVEQLTETRTRYKLTRLRHTSHFYKEFLLISVVFTLAHGLFLGLIIGLSGAELNRAGLINGLVLIVALQALNFAGDMFNLKERSFAWVKRMAGQALGRVVLVHFAIIFGVLAGAIVVSNPLAFFVPFALLKTLSDVAGAWNSREAPAEAPAWLTSIMNRIRPGEDFAAYWREDHNKQLAQAAEDEEVMPAEKRPGTGRR